MLKIFKTSTIEKKIKKVKRITVDTWLELTSPTNDEIDKVVEILSYKVNFWEENEKKSLKILCK